MMLWQRVNKDMQSNISKKEGIIYIEGTVTFETVAVIQKNIAQLLQDSEFASKCSLDLKAVAQVNSAALALLVELKKQSILHKRVIVFLHPPERLLLLAQVCGVAEWLDFN